MCRRAVLTCKSVTRFPGNCQTRREKTSCRPPIRKRSKNSALIPFVSFRRCRAERELGPSWPAHGRGGHGLQFVDEISQIQSEGSAVVRPRPFRAFGGAWLHVALQLLYLTGYDLPLEELKRFRQWGSKTPGHPERGHTVGVEVATGPLGQGFGNGVGMAIAEAWLAAQYNRPGHEIVNHYTYSICGDGDLMEGITSGGCLSRRSSAARQADLSLRPKSHLACRRYEPVFHRRCGQAIRRLWMAHAAHPRGQ